MSDSGSAAHSENSPPCSPSATTSSHGFKGIMSYAERRMSSQAMVGTDAGRRRTSSFGTYSRVVVVAVDSSDFARNAFEWYLSHIWRLEDLIVLVHCPEVPKLPSFSFKSGLSPPVDEWKKIIDEMNTRARKLEEDYESTCSMKKLKFKVRSEAFKNIGEGICRIADEEGADLIICGSQGDSGLKHQFKGSVCEYITRNSQIPTVVVPARK